jgi:heptaprenyl diphosphate synthase
MVKSLDLTDLLNIPQLPSALEQVDEALMTALTSGNPLIDKPLSRLIGTGSKRFRPTIVIAAAASQTGKINKQAVPGAVAVELAHIASLVHDDIIDNGTTRWGRPTINAKEGVSHAIIVGDYLLAKACWQAASISSDAAQLVASAIISICDGESRELGDRHDQDRSLDSLMLAIQNKTAALFSVSARIGGLAAGLDGSKVDALGTYGENLGISFQLIDDLLDLLSNPELIGKPVGGDAAEGIYTMPVLLGLKGPQAKNIKAVLNDQSRTNSELAKILLDDGSIQKTLLEIKRYNRRASEALKGFDNNKTAAGLKALPSAYLDWTLNNLIAEKYRSTVSSLA